MTEDEARKKWCPMARIASDPEDASSAYNRNPDAEGVIQNGSRCIASDCMMWRDTNSSENEARRVKGLSSQREGFCGLAGKP